MSKKNTLITIVFLLMLAFIITGCTPSSGGEGGNGGDGEEISVSQLDKNYYAAGEELEFTISGLRPNEEVKIGMPIRTGVGFGWASNEHVLTSGMQKDDQGHLFWFGTTDEYGELLVSGEVGPGLPYGELHVTLPDYDITIDNNLALHAEDGKFVHVGEPTP